MLFDADAKIHFKDINGPLHVFCEHFRDSAQSLGLMPTFLICITLI